MKNIIKKITVSLAFLAVLFAPLFVFAQVITPNYIAIQTPATKTEYIVGDELDISGLVVRGNYTGGEGYYNRTVTITESNISGFDSNTPVENQILTITFDGQTTTYEVDIVEAPLDSISIRVPANKLEYTVGDALDITGLVVCGSYVNRTPCDVDLVITGANISGFNSASETPSQTLTITYEGETTSYAISVVEEERSPSGQRRRVVGSLSSSTTVSTVETGNLSAGQGEITTGTTTDAHIFNTNLGYGMRSEEVRLLQERLRAEGFFTFHTSTGYFGPITLAAVKAYQVAKGIPFITGFVGPLTRAELNK